MEKKRVALVHCPPHQPRGRVLRYFDTIKQAEAYIGHIEKRHPVEVYRGDYSIDAPENMVNPSPSRLRRRDLLKRFELWIDMTCDASNRGDHDAKKVAEALVYFYREVSRIAVDEKIDVSGGWTLIAELFSHPKLAPLNLK
jgi:hypothetical protein